MLKKRTNITASSLASYFSVGFNTPEDQLLMDLGEKEQIFSDEAQRRLDYGNFFEDPILDWFEKDLEIIITDRNTEVVTAFDGMLRVKVDGMTVINGEPTVVECKFSNAKTGSFLDNKGYHLQLKAGMIAQGVEQGILLGMYQGLPQYTIIKIDDQDRKDIEEMCVSIGAILNGIADRSAIPYELIERLKNVPVIDGDIEVDFDNDDMPFVERYLRLKAEEKEIIAELKTLSDYLTATYPITSFNNGMVKVTVTNRKRAGGLDVALFRSEHPEIDLDKYKKEDSVYKTLTVRSLVSNEK